MTRTDSNGQGASRIPRRPADGNGCWSQAGRIGLCGTVSLLVALAAPQLAAEARQPYLVVLGIAQDGGVPQTGTKEHPGWTDPTRRRLVVSLGLVDPASAQRWMFEATPDFKFQLNRLDQKAPVPGQPGLDGIFLTHAHMGHYVGLLHLGHEALGARDVALYAMPRMSDFLRSNGPWDQLVRFRNIILRPLSRGQGVELNERLKVTPIEVPHRQEYSEVVGYRIEGPSRTALFIPDIDSWEEWDQQGVRIEDLLRQVDIAYLDGSFYANREVGGRDMSGFPHPFITHSLSRFAPLPLEQRSKVRFIHLNHTNPALWPGTEARKAIEAAGLGVAEEGDVVEL